MLDNDAFPEAFVARAVAHINDDHRHDMLDLVHGLAGQRWVEDATVLHADKLGIDLLLRGAGREERLRVAFDPPLEQPHQLRPALIALLERARQALAGAETGQRARL